MTTKTVFFIQYDGSRYQVRATQYGSGYATYDILQDRRVLMHSKYYTRKNAILELLQIVRLKVIQS